MEQLQLQENIRLIRSQLQFAYKCGNIKHVKKIAEWLEFCESRYDFNEYCIINENKV